MPVLQNPKGFQLVQLIYICLVWFFFRRDLSDGILVVYLPPFVLNERSKAYIPSLHSHATIYVIIIHLKRLLKDVYGRGSNIGP